MFEHSKLFPIWKILPHLSKSIQSTIFTILEISTIFTMLGQLERFKNFRNPAGLPIRAEGTIFQTGCPSCPSRQFCTSRICAISTVFWTSSSGARFTNSKRGTIRRDRPVPTTCGVRDLHHRVRSSPADHSRDYACASGRRPEVALTPRLHQLRPGLTRRRRAYEPSARTGDSWGRVDHAPSGHERVTANDGRVRKNPLVPVNRARTR